MVNDGRFKKGMIPWNKGKSLDYMKGENHHAWKGNDVGYRGLHYWIERKMGKPIVCGFEGSTCKGMVEWASLNGKYNRDLNNWVSLCRSHHRRLDNRRKGECNRIIYERK